MILHPSSQNQEARWGQNSAGLGNECLRLATWRQFVPVLGHFCPGASLSPEECQEGGEIWNPSLLKLNGFLPTTLPRSHSGPSFCRAKAENGSRLRSLCTRSCGETARWHPHLHISLPRIYSADQKNHHILVKLNDWRAINRNVGASSRVRSSALLFASCTFSQQRMN